MKESPNTVYVPLRGESDPKQEEIYDWVKAHGHMIGGTTNHWRDLEPHQIPALHSHLLGKWMRIVKHQKGLIDHDAYDPNVILLFKLTWR